MVFLSDPCQKKAVPELIEVAGRCFTVYSYYKVRAGFEMRATVRKGNKKQSNNLSYSCSFSASLFFPIAHHHDRRD